MLPFRYIIEHGMLKVDERIPEDLFIKLMIKKANVIKNHLKMSIDQLIIVANIGPIMPSFLSFMIQKRRILSNCA